MSERLFFSLLIFIATVAYALLRVRRPSGEKGWHLSPPTKRTDGEGKSSLAKGAGLATLIDSIPKGRVATFATLAEHASQGLSPAQVARQVKGLATKSRLPWWRVVRKEGGRGLVPVSKKGPQQRLLLEKEGVVFQEDFFPLSTYEWKPGR